MHPRDELPSNRPHCLCNVEFSLQPSHCLSVIGRMHKAIISMFDQWMWLQNIVDGVVLDRCCSMERIMLHLTADSASDIQLEDITGVAG